MEDYRLCFMESDIAYFYKGSVLDLMEDSWGRKGYEHGANAPTGRKMGEIVRVVFSLPYDYGLPSQGFINSPYSVRYINEGKVPWMRYSCYKRGHIEGRALWAGTSLREFREELEYCGGTIHAVDIIGAQPRTLLYSDPHFNHENIISYGERPFSTLEEMHLHMIEAYNRIVRPHDIVYFLGDVGMGDVSVFLRQMKGEKRLILGNHDRMRSVAYWMSAGFDWVSKNPVILRGKYILSHEPMEMSRDMPYLNLHGHIHQRTSSSPKHINLSVERTNYEPILLDNVIKMNKRGEL